MKNVIFTLDLKVNIFLSNRLRTIRKIKTKNLLLNQPLQRAYTIIKLNHLIKNLKRHGIIRQLLFQMSKYK